MRDGFGAEKTERLITSIYYDHLFEASVTQPRETNEGREREREKGQGGRGRERRKEREGREERENIKLSGYVCPPKVSLRGDLANKTKNWN